MKLIKEYNMENGSYDKYMFKMESQAEGMLEVLRCIVGNCFGSDDSQSLRTHLKYTDLTPDQYKILDEMSEWVHRLLRENEVDLEIDV